jgi:hypothetical protein
VSSFAAFPLTANWYPLADMAPKRALVKQN